MKRILMVCNHFAPDATIAAIRTTKLAKYLKKHGYDVTFLAEKKKDGGYDRILAEDAEGIPVIYAENSKQFMRFFEAYKTLIKPHKEKRMSDLSNRNRVNPKTGNIEFYPFETAYPVIGSLDYLTEYARQYNLFKSVKKYLRDEDEYDYILTSYGDAFSWFCGKYYKKCHASVPWHLDIRDAIWRYKFIPDYVGFIPRIMEKKAWMNADVITGVSKGICRRVAKRYRKKVHLLTNGYDGSELIEKDYKGIDKTGVLEFTYTGSMYGGIRDLTPVFEAVKKLIEEGVVDRTKVSFNYAGNASAYEIFKDQAGSRGLDDRCVYHGKLKREESIHLQRQADILMVASYDYEQNPGGVITGKVYEYMSVAGPVIAVVSGDIKQSEIAEIVRRTGIGIAYEEAHKAADKEKLKSYIRKQYENKMQGRSLEYMPVEDALRKYDYEYIGKKLLRIVERTLYEEDNR